MNFKSGKIINWKQNCSVNCKIFWFVDLFFIFCAPCCLFIFSTWLFELFYTLSFAHLSLRWFERKFLWKIHKVHDKHNIVCLNYFTAWLETHHTVGEKWKSLESWYFRPYKTQKHHTQHQNQTHHRVCTFQDIELNRFRALKSSLHTANLCHKLASCSPLVFHSPRMLNIIKFMNF